MYLHSLNTWCYALCYIHKWPSFVYITKPYNVITKGCQCQEVTRQGAIPIYILFCQRFFWVIDEDCEVLYWSMGMGQTFCCILSFLTCFKREYLHLVLYIFAFCFWLLARHPYSFTQLNKTFTCTFYLQDVGALALLEYCSTCTLNTLTMYNFSFITLLYQFATNPKLYLLW